MVHAVVVHFGAGGAGDGLVGLACWQHAVVLGDLVQHGCGNPGDGSDGRKAARGNSQDVEISLVQGLPAVMCSKPGRASGAGSTAKSPGPPATGMVTGRRVIVSRTARATMRMVSREVTHGLDADVGGQQPEADRDAPLCPPRGRLTLSVAR